MPYAEHYAHPTQAYLGGTFPRRNDLGDLFFLRWGQIYFDCAWGPELNIKVILNVWHEDNTCDRYIVHTDPYDIGPTTHRRRTRDFYIHPAPRAQGRVVGIKFSYIAHLHGHSIPSEREYLYMTREQAADGRDQLHDITDLHSTPNTYRTVESDSSILQRDVDWMNHHVESLGVIPKFTKGQAWHPYHPKRYIHDMLDTMIWRHNTEPNRDHSVKVCVDCIDDTDFVRHLLHAHASGVPVQIVTDWRKMTLTNADTYLAVKRSGIELLGEVCTTRDPSSEVAPDMHNKFITFGDEDAIVGSFNITFDRWGSNWESGMTFRSRGIVRLLDNIFQSVRGGVIQPYGIDPFSPFNLLYTFGQTKMLDGTLYLPHHAILSEINRAKFDISVCLFLIGELRGAHGDSVIDALIRARDRGVHVRLILNGHLAREGDPGAPHSWDEEIHRPLLPAVRRLRDVGLAVALVYGVHDRDVPYSPIHSKQCVIDRQIVLDGSFNWYNTSVVSHDMLIVLNHYDIAQLYLQEADQILSTFRTLWLTDAR